MAGISAIGIYNNLTTGKTGIARGATQHKASCGIDIDLGLTVKELGGNDGLDDMLQNIGADLLQRHVGAMLRRNHNRVHSRRLAINIFYRYLRLSVGTKIRKHARFTNLSQSLCHLVCQGNGKRHQLGSLIASVAEHQTLVTRTGIKGIIRLSDLCFKGLVHTHRNIG